MISTEVLEDHREELPVLRGIELPQVDPIQGDTPLRRVVQAAEQLHQGRLSGAVHPDQRHHLAGPDGQVHAFQDGPGAPRIAERDPLQVNPLADRAGHRHRLVWCPHRRLHLQEIVQEREEEVILVEAAERPEQAAHHGLALLNRPEVHHQISEGEGSFERLEGDQREGAEDRQSCHHLRCHLPSHPLPGELDPFLPNHLPQVPEPVHQGGPEVEGPHLLGRGRIHQDPAEVVRPAFRRRSAKLPPVGAVGVPQLHPQGRNHGGDKERDENPVYGGQQNQHADHREGAPRHLQHAVEHPGRSIRRLGLRSMQGVVVFRILVVRQVDRDGLVVDDFQDMVRHQVALRLRGQAGQRTRHRVEKRRQGEEHQIEEHGAERAAAVHHPGRDRVHHQLHQIQRRQR